MTPTLQSLFASWPFWVKAVVCFSATWVIDVCYAKYLIYTTDGRPSPAATYGTLVYLFGAVNVLSYSQDPWLLVPILIGGWLGTYTTVWKHAREKRTQADASESSREAQTHAS